MDSDDRVGEQSGRVEVADLFGQPPFGGGDRMDRVGDRYLLEHGITEHGWRFAHEQPVGGCSKNPRCADFMTAPGSALQGAAGADQVAAEFAAGRLLHSSKDKEQARDPMTRLYVVEPSLTTQLIVRVVLLPPPVGSLFVLTL